MRFHLSLAPLIFLSSALAAQTKLDPLPLARLVPKGTTVYVEFASVQAAYHDVMRLAEAFDEPFTATEDEFVKDMLSFTVQAVEPEFVDRTRPIALAIEPKVSGTALTFLVPAKNVDGLAKAVQGNEYKVFTSGDYVVWSDHEHYAPSEADAPIAIGAPRGSMRAHADMAVLLKEWESQWKPMLESAHEASTSGTESVTESWLLDPTSAVDSSFDAVDAFFASAKRLDVALEIVDDSARFLVQLDTTEGSPLSKLSRPGSTSISRLASAVDLEQPLAILFGADMPSWRKHVGGFVNAFIEGFPDGAREDIDKIFTATDDDLLALGPGVGVTLGYGQNGTVLELVTAPTNAGRCTSRVTEGLASPVWKKLGIRAEGPFPALVAATPSIRWKLALDPAVAAEGGGTRTPAISLGADAFGAAFPRKEAFIHLLQKGDLAALVIAQDEAAAARTVARLGPVRTSSKEMEFALREIGHANPCVIAHFDPLRLRKSFEDATPADKRPMTPLVLWSGAEGSVWHAGVAADLKRWLAAAKAERGAAATTEPK